MPSESHKTKIAFSVTNCICFDRRVQKIAASVSKLDCEVTIIGRKLGGCCDSDSVPFNTHRFRMIFRRGFLFYKFINLRLFFYLLFHDFDILVANDLDTLLPNYLVSKLKHLKLVYDSHEYFTGVPEIQDRPFVKWVWTTIEKSIFPRLIYVTTVSDSIAEEYARKYGIRPLTVRNCAESSGHIIGYSHEELGICMDDLLLILQGTGINTDRGGEELIDAMATTDGISLLIVGSGDVVPALKKKAADLKLNSKIKFIPAKPWNEMIRYTKSADAGLTLDKDTNLNHSFSLPNKLFDYISAGIPVIAGNLPEISKIVEKYKCGIIVLAITTEEISNAIKRMKADRNYLEKLRQNAVIASKDLTWERESEKVVGFYSSILKQLDTE